MMATEAKRKFSSLSSLLTPLWSDPGTKASCEHGPSKTWCSVRLLVRCLPALPCRLLTSQNWCAGFVQFSNGIGFDASMVRTHCKQRPPQTSLISPIRLATEGYPTMLPSAQPIPTIPGSFSSATCAEMLWPGHQTTSKTSQSSCINDGVHLASPQLQNSPSPLRICSGTSIMSISRYFDSFAATMSVQRLDRACRELDKEGLHLPYTRPGRISDNPPGRSSSALYEASVPIIQSLVACRKILG